MYKAGGASTSGLLGRPQSSASQGSLDPYLSKPGHNNTISDKFSLAPDPNAWGTNLNPSFNEPDDFLHNPEVRNGKVVDHSPFAISNRGFWNLGCLAILALGLIGLFLGYPLATFARDYAVNHNAAFALGVNASGQVPQMPTGRWSPIDADTPQDAYTIKDLEDGKQWQLVFSDEFNVDGRSFYPGDDPYWEAVDLHYWGTNNMEWYDPSMITTEGGDLVVSLDAKPAHGLDYMGGMMSTWNKFCFTGGYVVTSVTLPGVTNVVGLWPAIWTMGNLGRAGYGASLDGMWPYTYDACDVGTAPNQTIGGKPEEATKGGWPDVDYHLSYLPGQRLSRCTCPGESHPGPKHADGSYVGRAAPEIDIFEAQVSNDEGEVSQSGQWAPFNHEYTWLNTTDNLYIADPDISILNSYMGGSTQQATSVVSKTNGDCYQLGTGCKSIYGFQYKPGYDEGYITWVSDGKVAWTMRGPGMGPDPSVEVSARPVPQEPLYLLMNLGMSRNFGEVDLEHLTFPAKMTVDYVRVYQDPKNVNIGCDPPDFPTQAYIETYKEAYSNPNLTTWVDDYHQVIPKNRLLETCD